MSQTLTQREEDAQLRLDFAAFAQRCFRELNPLTALAMNWHVEVIAAKLAALRDGRIQVKLTLRPVAGFKGDERGRRP